MSLVSINSNKLCINRQTAVNQNEITKIFRKYLIRKKDKIHRMMKKKIIIISCLPLRSWNIPSSNLLEMLNIIITINREHNSNPTSNLRNFKSNSSWKCSRRNTNMTVFSHLINWNSVFGIKWCRRYMNF